MKWIVEAESIDDIVLGRYTICLDPLTECKDCKWKQGAECVRFADVRPWPNDFCSRAERRIDEVN